VGRLPSEAMNQLSDKLDADGWDVTTCEAKTERGKVTAIAGFQPDVKGAYSELHIEVKARRKQEAKA